MRPSTSRVTNSRRIAAASSLETIDRMSPSIGLPVGESQVSRKKETSRSPRPSRPGASSLGMNSFGSTGNWTAARNMPSFDSK